MVNAVNVYHNHRTPPILPLQCHSPPPPRFTRGVPGKLLLKCSYENTTSSNVAVRRVLSGFAASLIFISQTNQHFKIPAKDLKLSTPNPCISLVFDLHGIPQLLCCVFVSDRLQNGFVNGLKKVRQNLSQLHSNILWNARDSPLACSNARSLHQTSGCKVLAADVFQSHNICQLASAEENKITPLPLDDSSGGGMGKLMMMRAMTAKDFDPVRYAGRWFEVASLKGGFAGQGQGDCHCTQGVYTLDLETPAILVDTFCVHGGPSGYITGIRGKVQCLSGEDLEKQATVLEKQEMIAEKCFLRFPTLPFIPKEPYDVIATDYDNFALVSGAKDKSFIQIYSRTPNPGPEFIEKYKAYLANFGYDPSKIKDTPQDCEVMSNSKLAAMMSMPGMQKALTNEFPDLELKRSVEFNPFTGVFDTLKKLLELYFK